MTAPVPEVAGPVCDVCGQEGAAVSLMFLADYSQVKFGMDCAAAFLAQQLAAIDPDGAALLVAEAVAAVRTEAMVSRQDAEAEVDDAVAAHEAEVFTPYTDGGDVSRETPQSPPLEPLLSADDVELIRSGAVIQRGSHITLPSGLVMNSDDWAAAGGQLIDPPSRPDPLTDHVVRSTHGHRRGRSEDAAGAQASDSKSG